MADVAKRLKALAGTVASFAADLFDGRMGIHTDGPAGGPQWAVRVAGVWQYAARGLVDGWADNKGYKVNGVTAIAADRSASFTALTVDGEAIPGSSYACIYMSAEGGTAQSIPAGTTMTKITPFTTNMAGNVGSTPDQANDKIIAGRAGVYVVGFTRTYLVGTANVVWHIGVFVDGVLQQQTLQSTKSGSTATPIYAAMNALIYCDAGADVDVRVSHDSGAAVSHTYEHATLYISAQR